MRASDIMSTLIVALRPQATLDEAALVMTSQGFTTLPVVDSYGHLLGLLSESDLIHASAESPGDPRPVNHPSEGKSVSSTVETVMRTPGIGVDPRCELTALANEMIEKNLRSLPVVRDGQVIGIVTFRDLLRALPKLTSHQEAEHVSS